MKSTFETKAEQLEQSKASLNCDFLNKSARSKMKSVFEHTDMHVGLVRCLQIIFQKKQPYCEKSTK